MQEVCQHTHPVLSSDRALYIVVYSLRTALNLADIQRHLMCVTRADCCNDAPILLVGTHLDATVADGGLPLAALKLRYPQVLPN